MAEPQKHSSSITGVEIMDAVGTQTKENFLSRKYDLMIIGKPNEHKTKFILMPEDRSENKTKLVQPKQLDTTYIPKK